MASDHLFRLIKSLNKNEKVYIKRSAALHTIGDQNNYIRLFDIMSGMKDYNEEELIEKFGKWNIPGNFSSAKNYLMNFILMALQNYHQTPASEVRNLLHQAEILEDRGLMDIARKRVLRAAQLVEKHDLVGQMLSVVDWSFLTAEPGLKGGEYEEFLESLRLKIGEVQEVLKEYLEMKYHYFRNMGKGLYLNPDNKTLARQEIESELARFGGVDPNRLRSFSSRFFYLEMMRMLHVGNNNQEMAGNYARKVISLYLENPQFIENQLYTFLFFLREGVHFEFRSGNLEKTLEYCQLFKNLCEEHGSTKTAIYLLQYNLKMVQCIRLGEFEAAREHSEKMEELLTWIDLSPVLAEERKLFLYRSAVIYMGLEKYQEALRFTNMLLDTSPGEMLGDSYYFALIFQLLIYYEKGDAELIDYKARSVYRTLLRQRRKTMEEKLLIQFFKNTHLRDLGTETDQAFRELERSLIEARNNSPQENLMARYFDILSWIKSKLERDSYSNILWKKNGKGLDSQVGKALLEYITQS